MRVSVYVVDDCCDIDSLDFPKSHSGKWQAKARETAGPRGGLLILLRLSAFAQVMRNYVAKPSVFDV